MTSNAGKPQQKWINGLDTLRFVLALIVLLSHIPCPWADTLKASSTKAFQIVGSLLPNFFSGVGAVIAFFIISGFVIHYPNRDGITDVRKFLARRWIRIILPLIAISIIGWSLGSFEAIPIWSLYCELIYYTIYPLLCKSRLNWRVQFWISFVVAAVFIVVFAWNDISSLLHRKDLGYSGGYWQLGNFLTWIVGLPCWLLGVVLAQELDSSTKKVGIVKILSWRVAVFTIGVGLNIAKFHFFLSYILSMNIFALVLFCWLRDEIQYYKHRKSSATLEYMGKFSYSLYLCHGVVYHFLVSKFANTNTTYLLFILLGVAMAYVFYLLVENPSHKLAQKIGKMV